MGNLAFQKIVLYDGVCNLCDSAVRFILPRDTSGKIGFASLQGAYARDLMSRHKLTPLDPPESIIFIDGDRVYQHSSAMLRIAGELRFPWNLARVFLFIPSPLRDGIYRLIARNRYRWFGKQDVCLMPQAKWRARFID